MDLGDVIALLALILAGYSAYKTIKFNQRQNEFSNTADHLNKWLLKIAKDEVLSSSSADIGARFVSSGPGNIKLRVFNKGKSAARNVNVILEPVKGMYIITKDVLPAKCIDPQSNIDCIASSQLGSPQSIEITLMWDDDYATGRKKTISIATSS